MFLICFDIVDSEGELNNQVIEEGASKMSIEGSNNTTAADCKLRLKLPKRGRPTDDSWFPHIMTWIPAYFGGFGNTSLVQLRDASRFHYGHSSVQTARDVNRYYQIDVGERRYQYQHATKRWQSVPIVLPSLDAFYIPVKARAGDDLKTKRDGTIGYVAADAVVSIEPIRGCGRGVDGLRMHLVTGDFLDLAMSRAHYEEQYRCAQNFMAWLQYRYRQQNWKSMFSETYIVGRSY